MGVMDGTISNLIVKAVQAKHGRSGDSNCVIAVELGLELELHNNAAGKELILICASS